MRHSSKCATKTAGDVGTGQDFGGGSGLDDTRQALVTRIRCRPPHRPGCEFWVCSRWPSSGSRPIQVVLVVQGPVTGTEAVASTTCRINHGDKQGSAVGFSPHDSDLIFQHSNRSTCGVRLMLCPGVPSSVTRSGTLVLSLAASVVAGSPLHRNLTRHRKNCAMNQFVPHLRPCSRSPPYLVQALPSWNK